MENLTERDELFELWWLLITTTNMISCARTKELSRYSLTQAEASVIFVTHMMGTDTRPIDLADWAGKKRHTITSVLAKMVRAGRVKKTKDAHSPKITRVALTNKGNRLVPHVFERDSIHKIFRCLSDEEREQLQRLLLKLRTLAYPESGVHRMPPYPPSP